MVTVVLSRRYKTFFRNRSFRRDETAALLCDGHGPASYRQFRYQNNRFPQMLVVLRTALDGYGSTTEHSAAVRARLQPTSVLARGAPNLKKLQHIQLFICFAMSARWARGPIYVKMKGPRLLWERLGGFWDDLGAIWAVLGSVLDQHCHHF